MTMHKKHHYRELLSIGFPIIIGQLVITVPPNWRQQDW